MLPRRNRTSDIWDIYGEGKINWHVALYEGALTRPFGEAAYYIKDAYDKICTHPVCYGVVKNYLTILDIHEDKDARGYPKRNDVDKIIALQSAIIRTLQPTSPLRNEMYMVLTPPNYAHHGYKSDMGRTEYVEAILKQDFHPPSRTRTLRDIMMLCRYDLTGQSDFKKTVMDYYAASQTIRTRFKNGFKHRL